MKYKRELDLKTAVLAFFVTAAIFLTGFILGSELNEAKISTIDQGNKELYWDIESLQLESEYIEAFGKEKNCELLEEQFSHLILRVDETGEQLTAYHKAGDFGSKFEELDKYGEYPVEFIGHVIELMMMEEKTGNRDAYMFKDVLDALYSDAEIFTIVQKATFRGA